ncbi:Histone-lysine N-methyltransferase set9 [Grifola frondosa]|uniref:Histone-lysine N-methyltransferase set9 n=1 Tax=Grifola frondosa TaxID=5627 RepID=A0A1C7LTR5_GRIFR|nr:Histone-lysine N-methyltransferase set9 [Grifola frondosa]
MPKPVAGNRSSLKGAWRPTKIMNARDLSRDDDFLSHLLVEKLGTGTVPLVVHKMDPSRELPKTESSELLQIVRRLVAAKGPAKTAIRHAVDEILSLPAVRYYLLHYNQKQINAFATHASRYFELYLPSGSIEIAHTSRYSHRTGKSELCILSTRPLVPGQVISELKGSMADLTDKEDKDLKRTDERHTDGVGIRRDFSVIHSKQLKKNHLFLGPARFVNHDCDHNVELFREGRYITFRVIKPIAVGEEVTAHYGDGYFGRKNRHCLYSGSGTRSDVESDAGGWDSSSTNDSSDWTTDEEVVNVNERRTRRGVYAVVEDRSSPTSGAGPIELDAEVEPDTTSDLTSLASSSSSVAIPPNEGPSKGNGLMTPDPEPSVMRGWSASVTPSPRKSTPAGVSTRSQITGASTQDKGKGVAKSRSASSVRQLETPPLTSDNGSAVDSLRSSSRIKGRAPTKETSSSRSTPMKGRGRASARGSTVDAAELKGRSQDDPELETRTLRKRVFLPSAADAPKAAVISLDDQVIWGLSLGRTGKRGRPRKNVNVECPRCMRHFEIYALKWPERVPTRGGTAFVPEPREFKSNTPTEGSSSRKITPHTLHALDRKLSAATVPAKRPYKRLGEGEEVDDDRPAKRKKPSTGRPRGRPPKNRQRASQ